MGSHSADEEQVTRTLAARGEALMALPEVVGTALGRGRHGTATIRIYVLTDDVAAEVDHRARALLPDTPIEVLVTGPPTEQTPTEPT